MESFADRIAFIAERTGSAAELARRTGISRRAIGTYLAGTAEPSRTNLILMAEAADVAVGWLAAGEGQIMPAYGDAAPPLPASITRRNMPGGAEGDVGRLGRHAAQGYEWQVMQALLTRDPKPLTSGDVLAAVERGHRQLTLEDVEDYLAVLHRRGIVREITAGHFGLVRRDGRIAARDIPDIYRAAGEAVSCLIDQILPAAERQDGSAALTQLVARVPTGQAKAVLKQVKHLLIDAVTKGAAEEGGDELRLVFGGVIRAAVDGQEGEEEGDAKRGEGDHMGRG